MIRVSWSVDKQNSQINYVTAIGELKVPQEKSQSNRMSGYMYNIPTHSPNSYPSDAQPLVFAVLPRLPVL
jgi:hypothetical protein